MRKKIREGKPKENIPVSILNDLYRGIIIKWILKKTRQCGLDSSGSG
jgi:hypothetical protein